MAEWNNQFQDKVVVVTGGAQGIGRCIADEFRKEGALVCIDGGMTKQMIYHGDNGWSLK